MISYIIAYITRLLLPYFSSNEDFFDQSEVYSMLYNSIEKLVYGFLILTLALILTVASLLILI